MSYATHEDAARFTWVDEVVEHHEPPFDAAPAMVSSSTTLAAPTAAHSSTTDAWGGSLAATHPELVDQLAELEMGPGSPWAVAIPQPQMYASAPMLVQHHMQPSSYLRAERQTSPHAPTLMIRPPSWRDGMVGLLIGLVTLALPVSGAIAWGMKDTTPAAPVAAAVTPVTTAATPVATTPAPAVVDPNAAAAAAGTTPAAGAGAAPAGGGMSAGTGAAAQGGAAGGGAKQNAGAGQGAGAKKQQANANGGGQAANGGGQQQAAGGQNGGANAAAAAQQAQAAKEAAAQQAQQAAAAAAAQQQQAQVQPAPEKKAVAWTATSIASGNSWDMPEGQDAQIKDNPAFNIRPKYEDGSLGDPLPPGQSVPD